MQIEVYGLNARWLGTVNSFGEAKRLQFDHLPDELKPAYAGIQDGHPIFYTEFLTPELIEKYPQLGGR